MKLHINVPYGENEHHVVESIFKAFGLALDLASAFDGPGGGVRSSKRILSTVMNSTLSSRYPVPT